MSKVANEEKPAVKTAAPAAAAAAKTETPKRRTTDHEEGHGKHAASPEKTARTLTRAVILLAVIVALAAVAGAVMQSGQLAAMRGELDAMQAAAKRGDDNSAALTRLVDSAKRSGEMVPDLERAYLFVESSGTVLPKTIATGTSARLVFKNFGKTPAVIKSVLARYSYAAAAPTKIVAGEAAAAVEQVIPDGGSVGPYEVDLDASEEDLDHARQGQGVLVIQALARYGDIFGETHETALCFQYSPKNSAFSACQDPNLTYRN